VPLVEEEETFAATVEARVGGGEIGDIGRIPPRARIAVEKGMALAQIDIVHQHLSLLRRGTIELAGRDVAFAIEGRGGVFNSMGNRIYFDVNGDGSMGNRIYFDVNGDGTVNTKDRISAEVFDLSERFVTLDQTSYEFLVDHWGDRVTLRPLDEVLPARPSLEPGSLAPDFSLVDIDGGEHKLSDYRQRVVLLDFWGTWCWPCRQDTPQLTAVYERFHESGFEILAISRDDEEASLREYVAENGIRWPQAIEERNGPIQSLYRVSAFPTYFLIDGEGAIVLSDLPGREIMDEVSRLLG
jgi:peroxiredoxin